MEHVKFIGKLKHCVRITYVYLEDLHCFLANFFGLICHYLISKIKKISYNFILCFYLQVLFVISVLGLVLVLDCRLVHNLEVIAIMDLNFSNVLIDIQE